MKCFTQVLVAVRANVWEKYKLPFFFERKPSLLPSFTILKFCRLWKQADLPGVRWHFSAQSCVFPWWAVHGGGDHTRTRSPTYNCKTGVRSGLLAKGSGSYVGKCLTTDSPGDAGAERCFVMFAEIGGVNYPTVANFKQATSGHWAWG